MRNFCLYKYSIAIAFCLPLLCNAQEEEEYDYGDPDTLIAVVNAIKFDPVQVLFGDFQFYYERIISDRWSIEAGFGPSRRNYTASLFEYELDDFGSNIDIQTRYAASLWARRYFWDSGELYGLYLAGAVLHRRNDKTYNVIGGDGELTGHSFDDSRAYTSFMLFTGYQALTLASNIFFDFYIGAGLRYRDFEVVRSSDLNDPDAFQTTSEQSWIGAFQAGIKVGVGF